MSVEAISKHTENGPKNASDADSLRSLYADHEIQDEIVVGPVEIRRPVVTFKFKAPNNDPEPCNSESCKTCQTEDIKHFTCSECDMQVFSAPAILAHLRKHRRPPTICGICKKSFQYEHKFKKHMITHSKERSFSCNVCQKAYKHMSSLRVHKCSKPERKAFECQHCSKSFSFKGQLQAHTRLHTGEKPYRCDMCSKEFTQQTSLNNHVLKHKGIKPHCCEFCKETFRQVSNLKKHIELKHPEKKIECHLKSGKRSSISLVWYSCKNCQVVLSGRDSINKHMETCKLRRGHSNANYPL